MAGLVGYASSDEEDEVPSQPEVEVKDDSINDGKPQESIQAIRDADSESVVKRDEPVSGTASAEYAAPVGPSIGPSLPPPGDLNLPDADEATLEDEASDPDRPPQSPYSATRSLIHDLTLPSVPDFDIPPSPPGSPPAAIDKKFAQFLDLKKKGIHFNQKLEQSAALKNPNLMDKLMRFVELEGASQYETTLSKDLWDPATFPEWAYRDSLRKSREQLVKERETHNSSGTRKAVDFVPASKASTRK